jgi:hypothetical protein
MADPLLDLLNGTAQAPQSAPGVDPLMALVGTAPSAVLTAPAKQVVAAPPMQVSPPTGSFLDNAMAGAGKFVSDTGQGTKQLLNDLAAGAQSSLQNTKLGQTIDWLNGKLGLQSPQDIQSQGRQDIAETRRLDAPLMDTAGGKAGYVGGALATAPLLPAATGYGGAAAMGTLMGATQPALDWKERGINTATGLGSSVGGQAVVNGLARVVRPQTSEAVQTLIDSGVTPTPGQILGGGFKRAEEGATSVPIVGDFIKAAQNRGIGQLNDAVANRALAPVGDSLPSGVTGRAAVDYVGSKLGSEYDKLLPQMGATVDAPFAQQVNNLTQMVNSGNMGPQESQQFMAVLKNKVMGKFQGQNAATGETLKAMNSDLGQLAANYSRDPSFDKRQLGQAIGELQDAVRGMISRQNPQFAPQLSAIDSGYAIFKRMQRAASSVAADDGVYTPSQLQAAVKALDRSKDKGGFASGNALLQDLSDPAKQVLAPKLNDSGTPYRSLLMAGAAGAAGHFVSPWAIPAAAAAPLLYSPTGQKVLMGALAQRPANAAAYASLLRKAAPAIAVGAPALSYAEQK